MTPPTRPPFLAAADPGITPPGWYTVADGRALWWDGDRWVVVPPATQTAVVAVTPAALPAQVTTTLTVRTNHLVHLILTVVTLGLWAPIWLAVAIRNARASSTSVTRFR
jgi:hypothetical protein